RCGGAPPAAAPARPRPRPAGPARARAAPPPAAPAPARVGGGAPGGAPGPARAPAPDPALAGATPFVAGGGRLRASPLAKKLAQRAGLDLAAVRGTGPGGRIIQRDIEGALAARGAAPAATAVPAPSPAVGAAVGRPAVSAPAAPTIVRPTAEHEDQPLSPIRAAIARQMTQAKAPVPHFYVTTEIAMERAIALRAELQALPGAPKLTFTDLIVRACAVTLVKHPGINASYQGETIRRHRDVHVGIAVALDEGLITPVLRDCDQKSVFQIATEARDLAERTRARKLRGQELSGATFSVSNLGMFPVDEFSAIINPPEGAILAVGAIREKPVVVNGQFAVGQRMRVTLSCDHRVMDGAMGARFLGDLKAALEAPLSLLV